MRAAVACVLLAACGAAPATPPATGGDQAVGPAAPAGSASASAPSSAPDATPSAPASSGSAAAPAASTAPAGPPPVGGAVVIGEINAPKSFDPRPTILKLKSKLLDCYNQTRASRPDLRGKLTLHIVIGEGGQALSADADQNGAAYDAGLVQCIEGVLKAGPKFPKPGGTATVNAPLVFHP
jgi:hypothetical protein